MGNRHQIEKLGEYRIRRKFCIFPFLLVNGIESDFIWTGKWFSTVTLKEEKVKERYLDFDDGWSYRSFWTQWEDSWKFVKIIQM